MIYVIRKTLLFYITNWLHYFTRVHKKTLKISRAKKEKLKRK